MMFDFITYQCPRPLKVFHLLIQTASMAEVPKDALNENAVVKVDSRGPVKIANALQ